ncbi:MAG TPA: virulence-associated E family protein [Dyadobacter sp.]|nr:virulence-associated E family protein [Dyadobacter sp.]
MLLELATGKSRNDTQWHGDKWPWERLVARCYQVHRSDETYATYQAGNQEFKQSKKDVGGFVSGWLDGGRRAKAAVMSKQILTLDVDYARQDFLQVLRAKLPNVAWIYYTTHSHSPDKPRYRLLIPLDRPAMPAEYEPVARWVAAYLGIEQFDRTCYDLNRLMFWPSCSADGVFDAGHQDGLWTSVDGILAQYSNWRDISQWPVADGEYLAIRADAQQMEDPHMKSGVIGAFCRMYTTRQLIDKFLGHIYVEGTQPNRYTLKNGTTSNGLWVIDDKFVLSFHSSDALGNKPVNVFDLFRIHLFGGADDNPEQAIGKRESFKKASEYIRELPEVRKAINIENYGFGTANEFFGVPQAQPLSQQPRPTVEPQIAQNLWQQNIAVGAPVPQGLVQPLNGHSHAPTAPIAGAAVQASVNPNVSADANDWLGELEVDGKGKALANVKNVKLIMLNDPRIKDCFARDIFAKQIALRGMVPWIIPGRTSQWTDVDDDALINFFGEHYGINSADIIRRVLNEITARHGFHPVKEYLESLVWDGTPRIEKLFHYFLGAEDNLYTREVSRKWFTAAVARIYEPGRKFDNMIVFVGLGGIGKSLLATRLGGKWFSDTSVDLRNKKESMEEMQGVWIMEWAELTSFRTSSIEAVKAFTSKQTDKYRAAYARRVEDHPRQCVFMGSTNRPEFLSDPDGNRRFWPVHANQVQPQNNVYRDLTPAVVGQIWAEACVMYAQGEELMLEPHVAQLAEYVQKRHTEVDEREHDIVEYLNKPLPADWYKLDKSTRAAYLMQGIDQMPQDGQENLIRRDKVCVREIWVELFDGSKRDADRHKTRFIHDIMRNLPDWELAKNPLNVGYFGRQMCYVRKGSGVEVRQ